MVFPPATTLWHITKEIQLKHSYIKDHIGNAKQLITIIDFLILKKKTISLIKFPTISVYVEQAGSRFDELNT
jgi:hypothetical protein